eukprot:4448187-Amphidinium_carterae.2
MKFRQPGPSDYNVCGTAGKPSPIKTSSAKGVYDITIGMKLGTADYSGLPASCFSCVKITINHAVTTRV